ncbi:lysozyme family protein [Peribacillus butanolivorans]|uniref:C40 family peptidase n=1 Tax=Peribacillus butanolivorans TaxID=421767 RepID=UPI003D29FC85
MVVKKTNNRPNSNFRQQDSTARKLENNFDTAAQKQFAQTGSVNEGTGNQQKIKGELQKQHTDQTIPSEKEFRQQESTSSKILKTLENNEPKHLSRSAKVLHDNSSENNSSFANINPNKGKLQKKYSNEVREEFRQQENTANKIDKVLQTEAHQQFAQSTSKIETKESNNQSKLNNQFGTADNHKIINGNFKQKTFKLHKEIAKGSLSTLNNRFKNGVQTYQKEFEKDDEVVEFTSQSITQTAKTATLSSTAMVKLREKKFENANFKNTKNNPLYKENSKQSILNKISKTSVDTLKNTTKNGLQKYQKEFEKDDEAVKFTSQSITQTAKTAKLSSTAMVKLREKKFENANFKNTKNNPLYKENSKESILKKISKTSVDTLKNTTKNGLQKYQKEFEKDDEAVKFTSQSITQTAKTAKLSTTAFVKLREKKLENSKNNLLYKEKLNESSLKKISKMPVDVRKNSTKNGLQKYEAVKFTSQYINQKTKTVKLSSTAMVKLKEKKLKNANLKKVKTNPLYKEKPKESSLKKISKTPGVVLKNTTKSGLQKYQNELEKDDVGVKLVSQGATQISRATKKLTKGVAKIDTKSGKLGKQGSKLTQFKLNKSKNLKSESKAVLQKKKIKKKLYYAPKNKRKAFAGAMTSFSNRMGDLFKNLANFNRMIVKRVLGAKVAAALGSGLASVLPLIIVAALVLIIVGVMGGSSTQNQPLIGSKNLSPEVEQWRSLVETEAAAQGMEKYINLILAIIQVETEGTGTKDIMQSSESAGHAPGYWSTEEESIRQGVKHLKNIVNLVKPFGLEDDYKLLAQAYNYGSYFATYVGNLGGSFNLDISEQYSRDVVAPSLGNHSGETYPYINPTSQRIGKTYLYRNGGNYLYAELVAEYLGAGAGVKGDFALVVAELEKYLGWKYVWGGKNPSTGFDCSGFVSWGLIQIGIDLPSYAASQYDLTVPIDPSEAQPGDLIFFKGTYGGANHVSHVAFYIDENTMLDSNGSGVGYHNWKTRYWQSHYAGIRRIAN